MKNDKLTHIDKDGNPSMVDVSEKAITKRIAKAQAFVVMGKKIMEQIHDNELRTKKGPVFQTAIIAGTMAAKNTASLIPLCHPLLLEDCQVSISPGEDRVEIIATAALTGKTGVEMEALTAVTVAALTIYDMCKAMSHDITIQDIRLLEKHGGKNDYRATGTERA